MGAFFAFALVLFGAAFFLGHVHAVHAATTADLGLTTGLGQRLGLATGDIRTYVGNIIRIFLSLLGIIAVVLVMYAGYLWMTAAGSDEKIKLAKRILVNAVIGLIIILAAYAIVSFIINALTGGTGSTVTTSGAGAPSPLVFSNRGADQLGNGIIEYHYPEPGQQDVVRNTKISITFKKPIVLSTIFTNYNDNNTYDPADDLVCPSGNTCTAASGGTPVTASSQLLLNTDNVKIIANSALAAGGSGTIDQQFSNRYPNTATVAATGRVTVVSVPLAGGQQQTIVLKPNALIGSPTATVNYRVALRGGDNGVKAWSQSATSNAAPTSGAAFARAYADGGYYWTFTTNTVVDTTPPKVSAVEPMYSPTPANAPLDRNQLLQIYFDEPIDPTTSTGTVGGTSAFNNVQVLAQCLPGTYGSGAPTDPDKRCVFNVTGNTAALGKVDGVVSAGNRSKTLEFVPNTPCESVSVNSCGERVYCLPKNVKLTVRVLAASIGTSGPTAILDDGIVDMADNSLDGNGNGTAQGKPVGSPEYYRNVPPLAGTVTSDSTYWDYNVGSNIDLVPPTITGIVPPPMTTGNVALDYPLGPSRVPSTLIPELIWSKTMSIASIRTGTFDESNTQYTPSTATLSLRSRECAKQGTAVCASPATCACTVVEPPGYFVDSGVPLVGANGQNYTKMQFLHPGRQFYTMNDLGYSDADTGASIPSYVPIARAVMKDTKQNCFWPSKFSPDCSTTTTNPNGQPSCCNRQASGDGSFLSTCTP